MVYIEQIKQRLELNPELKPLLVKVMRAVDKRDGVVPKQITLAACSAVDNFSLMQLFTPTAIKRQHHKFILIPTKMTMSGVEFTPWLQAVKSLLVDYRLKPKLEQAELLLERLNISFAQYPVALELLYTKRQLIKRKITENGYRQAFEYYTLALQTVDFLKSNSTILSPAELGTKLCQDSKALRAGSAILNNIIELLAAELNCLPSEALNKCGINDNKTAITVTVFGPFIYYRHGEHFDWINHLWQHGEAATLNAGNLQDIDAIELTTDFKTILTCENESPFNSLMRHKQLDKALVYTSGFPNSAVKQFITLLNNKINFLHWGDTDPEGLEIAAILNQIKPLQLYRCGAGEIERLKNYLIPLQGGKFKRAKKMLTAPEFKFIAELEQTIKYNGWLEQESWSTPLEN
ncbi:MAG: DUF2220 family protein [Victivallaceae bacterium]|nr:DUF2220 family protein [Victivallaceae bacterium]